MKNTMEPSTIIAIGMIVGLFSGKIASMSPNLNNGIAPAVIRAMPAICKINKNYFQTYERLSESTKIRVILSIFCHDYDKEEYIAFVSHKVG